MNAEQIYEALDKGTAEEKQQALLRMVGILKQTATAALELAGSEKRRTGVYPLMDRSRLMLGDFIGLEDRK